MILVKQIQVTKNCTRVGNQSTSFRGLVVQAALQMWVLQKSVGYKEGALMFRNWHNLMALASAVNGKPLLFIGTAVLQGLYCWK